tara:strand:- start:497 stop:1213 length:717 start_codon:yes stop_codon:yes gene_type:complete
MATTTASITLSSSDIMDNSLSISNTATLTKAGTITGLPDTTSLRQKRIASGVKQNLLLVDETEATALKANKIYIKNTGTSTAKYGTVSITSGDNDAETILGRLYGGDWMFIPWNAIRGAKEVFELTASGSWATGNTAIFDGVTAVVAGTETAAGLAAVIQATKYRNWVVTAHGSNPAISIFTAKYAGAQTNVAGDWVENGAGALAVSVTTEGTEIQDDITITMNDATETVIEYLAVYE